MKQSEDLSPDDHANLLADLQGGSMQPQKAKGNGRIPVADPPPKPKIKVSLMRASSIVPKPIHWLWRYYLAKGKVHIFSGSPGAGKTTIAASIAATISRGAPWPDGSHAALANVVIWSGEDSAENTLVPRLIAAGADMDNISIVGPSNENGVTRPFDPTRDVESLQEAIEELGGVALIIVDPITSAVSGDSNKNSDVRRALQEFVNLAEKTGAAVLGIAHLRKNSQGGDPLDRVSGAGAFGQVPRIVLTAAVEADPPEGQEPTRVFTRAKSNIGPTGGGFEYAMRQGALAADDSIETNWIEWGEKLDGNARQILARAEQIEQDEAKKPSLALAKRFLSDFLKLGIRSQNDCEAAATADGISNATLKRAREELGIASRKQPGKMKAPWFWGFEEDFEAAWSEVAHEGSRYREREHLLENRGIDVSHFEPVQNPWESDL
jgi:putative DNA primase/helicase